MRIAPVSFAVLGLGLASFGEAVRAFGLQVPCRNAVCGAVARDALNRFPPFTPGTFAILFFGVALGRSCRSTRLDRSWTAICALATGMAFALQAYVRERYGDFCPWCLGIAGCVAGLAFCEMVAPLREREGRWTLLVAGGVGFALALGFVAREKSIGVDRLALSELDAATISPRSSRIGSDAIGPVYFVDFSCGVCHVLMANRLTSGLPFAIRSAGRNPYGAAAARYLASFPTPRSRAVALGRLLDEPSGVAAAIAHLPPPPGPAREKTLIQDRRFFDSLRIVATPTVVEPTTHRVLDSD